MNNYRLPIKILCNISSHLTTEKRRMELHMKNEYPLAQEIYTTVFELFQTKGWLTNDD